MGELACACQELGAPRSEAATAARKMEEAWVRPVGLNLVGAANDCTSISPDLSGGSSWYVEPKHALGDSQTMSHFGFGHDVGALHLQLHFGCSHTLWHGCARGHCNMHIGSEHFVVHGVQPGPEHSFWGQATAQCGLPHSIRQLLRSVPVHRVWHVGLSHSGTHSCSQVGFVHEYEHRGVQSWCLGMNSSCSCSDSAAAGSPQIGRAHV